MLAYFWRFRLMSYRGPKRKLEVLPKLVFHDKFLWANSSESAVQAVRDMLSKRSR